jgi:muramoyltetrapeptide carboxypeptidase
MPVCLPTVASLMGTQWEPDWHGQVLVLDVPEPPYSFEEVRADLGLLREARAFYRLAGLAVGRLRMRSPGETERIHRLILECAGKSDYPVLADLEGAHTDPLPTLPIGTEAILAGAELMLAESGTME